MVKPYREVAGDLAIFDIRQLTGVFWGIPQFLAAKRIFCLASSIASEPNSKDDNQWDLLC
jgi:hypothetical protein